MKTLVIGDIHGCFAELQELLGAAGLADGDAIIALGDIVDRGPETPQVVEFFRSQANAVSLLGNHERKHIRSFHGELQPALSQRISRQQLGEGYAAAVAFMETFPLYIELEHAVLVHGYLEPGIPLDAQRHTVLCGTMSGDHYLQSCYCRSPRRPRRLSGSDGAESNSAFDKASTINRARPGFSTCFSMFSISARNSFAGEAGG